MKCLYLHFLTYFALGTELMPMKQKDKNENKQSCNLLHIYKNVDLENTRD
jgi:hypothetical protein